MLMGLLLYMYMGLCMIFELQVSKEMQGSLYLD